MRKIPTRSNKDFTDISHISLVSDYSDSTPICVEVPNRIVAVAINPKLLLELDYIITSFKVATCDNSLIFVKIQIRELSHLLRYKTDLNQSLQG